MKHVVLTGFMAVGKTAVGKRLARKLGWMFIDTDHLIEQREGKAVAEIFAEKGEQAFRRIEREVVGALDPAKPAVIATGGGTFIDERNREKLKCLGVVVCLVTKLETALARTARSARRPLAMAEDGERRMRFEQLYSQRMPAYRRADVFVETDGLSVDQSVARVLTMIEPHLDSQRFRRRLRS